MPVTCVLDLHQQLGEGPVWDEAASCLWWVDIKGPAVHRYDPATGAHASFPFPQPVGSLALRPDGTLLVAHKTALVAFDPERSGVTTLLELEPGMPGNRLNDGRCDRAGRFWVGTMAMGERAPTGTLWRFATDRTATAMRQGVRIPNSTAFSPDGRTMYFADTADGRILAFDYDPETGTPSNERTFAALDSAPGRPDGSTVDADGCLWNARYGGGCVARYAPDGRVDRIVELPVSQPTCPAFGGPGLGTLYVTSAAQNLTAAQLAAEPLAGALLAIEPGARGLPEARFLG
jgi:sugar lactone lactonase YvrE